jgi:hypothetical protein
MIQDDIDHPAANQNYRYASETLRFLMEGEF